MSQPMISRLPRFVHRLSNSCRHRDVLGTGIQADPVQKVQIWLSKSSDPYLNLAIEQHLLETTPAHSTVLFVYRNLPCVVIGRSQNPWLEVNFEGLEAGLPLAAASDFWPVHNLRHLDGGQETEKTSSLLQMGLVNRWRNASSGGADEAPGSRASPEHTPFEDLRVQPCFVRRKSGGGAVFHDWGNVNYSVIWPTASFDRDLHARLVAGTIRNRFGEPSARVNERHDIVMGGDGNGPLPLSKISGSAYRVTRQRSMHHGTCLLSSPYLKSIGPLLRSPAEPFLSSRGTTSVRSSVSNVFRPENPGPNFLKSTEARIAYAQAAIIGDFRAYYQQRIRGPVYGARVGHDAKDIPEVKAIMDRLKSPDWALGQTPQFTFSTHSIPGEDQQRPPLPADVPQDFRANLVIRHGRITEAAISGLDYGAGLDDSTEEDVRRRDEALSNALLGRALWEISDWRTLLDHTAGSPLASSSVGSWLNHMLKVEAPGITIKHGGR